MFDILKGVPIPEDTEEAIGKYGGETHKKYLKYPFAEMQKGDCFFVSFKKLAEHNAGVDRLYQSASQWKARHADFDYTIRKVPYGYNVWRT